LSLCREHESHSASACPAPACTWGRCDRVLRTAMGAARRRRFNRSRSVTRVHAGVNKIPCQYCHAYAARSSEPGVPAVARCVGCHGNGIARVESSRSPVHGPTTRNHRSRSNGTASTRCPDFVRFPHNPHIHAGVQCQSCHGRSRPWIACVPVYEINMGFCVDCHTERKATLDCVGCHH